MLYWHFSEQSGNGDLRPYVAVQLLPILTIPVILLTCKPRYTHSFGYWCLFAAYLLAKVLEYLDGEIYALLSVISGHSLKHIAIAVGVHLLLTAYARRTPHSKLENPRDLLESPPTRRTTTRTDG